VSNGPLALSNAVAIYAENGRGKSTFASLLRSLRRNDCTEVRARKSLREADDQRAELLINGTKHTLADGSWDHTYDGLHVFDDDFVENNLSAGRLIWAQHLENLLAFTLHQAGAQAPDDIEDALEDCLHGINSRLRAFRAGFELATLARNTSGEVPRADYSLRLMGTEVPLVGAEQTSPSYSTTLSPSDRRLLALAIFFCGLDGDAELTGKTVVFDDPTLGFDGRRKTRVAEAISGMKGRVQSIVLSYDPDLLSMLRDGGFDQMLQIRRDGQYCVFEDCDIDEVSAMDYSEPEAAHEGWQFGGHPF
jgi:wobble nucleotide-excising tRNase